MEKRKKQYFNEINIMRGMAVLCVVIGHSFNPTETPTILGFIKKFCILFSYASFFSLLVDFLKAKRDVALVKRNKRLLKKLSG